MALNGSIIRLVRGKSWLYVFASFVQFELGVELLGNLAAQQVPFKPVLFLWVLVLMVDADHLYNEHARRCEMQRLAFSHTYR